MVGKHQSLKQMTWANIRARFGVDAGIGQLRGGRRPVRVRGRPMRVHTGGRPDDVPEPHDSVGAGRLLRVRGLHDAQDAGERDGTGPLHDRLDISRERLVRQVCVGVDHG